MEPTINELMSFSDALIFVKKGKRIAREGWNGKGMWLAYVCQNGYAITATQSAVDLSATDLLPWLGMFTADKKFVPWLASQTDILAEDWMIVDIE